MGGNLLKRNFHINRCKKLPLLSERDLIQSNPLGFSGGYVLVSETYI